VSLLGPSAAVGLGTLLTMSCSSNGPTCDCADPTLTLEVPADIAPSVTAVALSGTACTGVSAACADGTETCSTRRFAAAAAGTCHIEVDFAGGTAFIDDVTIQATTGCCAGFYATPASAAQIDVPEPGDGGPQ
jgi:hypothetical protein